MKILKFEIKKMLRNRTSMVAMGLLVLLMLGLDMGYISGCKYVLENGNHVKGISAVIRTREEKSKWNGTLTEETIAKVIRENNTLYGNPAYIGNDGWLTEQGYSRQQGYYDIRDLINSTYRASFSDYDYFTINRLDPEDAGVFYDRREQIFDEWLGREEVCQQFSEGKRAYIREHALAIAAPYEYEYADGWIKVKEMNVTLLFAAVIVVCILLASDFAVECQTRADAIYLSTAFGKNKGNKMKIAAGFLVATLVYWGVMLIGDGILLSVYGISGGDVPIQMEFWKCLYSLTQKEAWLLGLLMGYVGCLVMSGLTMFMSSRFKTAFGAIILSFLIIMVPAIAGQSVMEPFWQVFFSLCPHGAIMSYDYLSTYVLYEIGNRVYSPYLIISLLHIPITLLTIPMTYFSFRKYKV